MPVAFTSGLLMWLAPVFVYAAEGDGYSGGPPALDPCPIGEELRFSQPDLMSDADCDFLLAFDCGNLELLAAGLWPEPTPPTASIAECSVGLAEEASSGSSEVSEAPQPHLEAGEWETSSDWVALFA